MRGEHYNKARRNLIEYYNICPLCKWSTNDCRITEWNRECIACTNPEWFGYSYKSKTITEDMILTEERYINQTLTLNSKDI